MELSFLIVDDEQLSRNYIRNMLQRHDPAFAIYDAASADEALELFENERIDILFLDIKMPGKDGFSFLNMLSHRNFELVFITAYNQHAIKAIKEGATDYLLKPIKKTDFIETLQRVITKRKKTLDAVTNELFREQLTAVEAELSTYIRSIKEKNELIEQLQTEIEQLQSANGTAGDKLASLDALQNSAILTEEDWNSFKEKFESVYTNFFSHLRNKYPSLTQAEVRLIALTKLNITTREMAGLLGISPETIRQTRWRLRKKMNLADEVSLEQFVWSI